MRRLLGDETTEEGSQIYGRKMRVGDMKIAETGQSKKTGRHALNMIRKRPIILMNGKARDNEGEEESNIIRD